MGYSPASMIAVAIIFSILPITGVIMRFWARKVKRVRLEIDDYLMLPALFCTLFVNVALIVSVLKGEHGSHQKLGPDGLLIHDSFLTTYEKTRMIMESVTFPALGFTKVSLLLLYKRIFIIRPFQIAVWVMVGITIAWTIAFFFAIIFQCHPVSVFWKEFEYQYGHSCVEIIPFYESTTYTDIILDVFTLAMPIPMVLRLHLPMRQKIGVSIIFLLGAFVMFASVTRLVLFFQLAPNAVAHYNDITFYTPPIFVWCSIELGTAVFCACLPTLRPLFTGDNAVFSLPSARGLLKYSSSKTWRSRIAGTKTSAKRGSVSGNSWVRQSSLDGDQVPLGSGTGEDTFKMKTMNSAIRMEV